MYIKLSNDVHYIFSSSFKILVDELMNLGGKDQIAENITLNTLVLFTFLNGKCK